MVKFVIFCTKIITVAIATALFTSCQIKDIHFGDGIDGNGNVTRQTRNVENNFSKIEVSRGLNVKLEQSDTYFVEVEADENLQGHIITTVENGTLVITTDHNIDEAKAKNIIVKIPLLKAIEATSGSSVKSNGLFTGTDINVKTSSGSDANIAVEIDNVICESTSGSKLTIRGKALQLNTTSSSGSSIEAQDLLVNNVIAQSTSGSSTNVNPIVSLNAKSSSGSSIDYKGSPKNVVKEESSGGSVSKE